MAQAQPRSRLGRFSQRLSALFTPSRPTLSVSSTDGIARGSGVIQGRYVSRVKDPVWIEDIAAAQRGEWGSFDLAASVNLYEPPEKDPFFIDRAYLSVVLAAYASHAGQHSLARTAGQRAAATFLHPRVIDKVGHRHANLVVALEVACRERDEASEGIEWKPDPWPVDRRGNRLQIMKMVLDEEFVRQNLALLLHSFTNKKAPYSLFVAYEDFIDPGH